VITIDKCPICGSEIQATVNLYLSDVVIDEHGVMVSSVIEHNSFNDGVRTQDWDGERIYCREDHSEYEMLEAWHAPPQADDDMEEWMEVLQA